MVSPVSLNTQINAPQQLYAVNQNVKASQQPKLFDNKLSTSGNDYSNDIMMQKLDFGKMAENIMGNESTQEASSGQTTVPEPQVPVQQVPVTQEFTGQPQTAQPLPLSEQLSNPDQAQTPNKANGIKYAAAGAGFAAPIVGKAIGGIKAHSFKGLFKFKELAVTCPIIGLIGLGVGILLEKCVKSHQSGDKSAQPQNS